MKIVNYLFLIVGAGLLGQWAHPRVVVSACTVASCWRTGKERLPRGRPGASLPSGCA